MYFKMIHDKISLFIDGRSPDYKIVDIFESLHTKGIKISNSIIFYNFSNEIYIDFEKYCLKYNIEPKHTFNNNIEVEVLLSCIAYIESSNSVKNIYICIYNPTEIYLYKYLYRVSRKNKKHVVIRLVVIDESIKTSNEINEIKGLFEDINITTLKKDKSYKDNNIRIIRNKY